MNNVFLHRPDVNRSSKRVVSIAPIAVFLILLAPLIACKSRSAPEGTQREKLLQENDHRLSGEVERFNQALARPQISNYREVLIGYREFCLAVYAEGRSRMQSTANNKKQAAYGYAIEQWAIGSLGNMTDNLEEIEKTTAERMGRSVSDQVPDLRTKITRVNELLTRYRADPTARIRWHEEPDRLAAYLRKAEDSLDLTEAFLRQRRALGAFIALRQAQLTVDLVDLELGPFKDERQK